MRRPPLLLRRIQRKTVRGATVFRLIEEDRGVTAIEYALLVALIALVFVALITQIGDFVSVPFETIAGQL